MKLFEVDWSFLEGIQPLFQPEDIVYFDRYLDGDPFEIKTNVLMTMINGKVYYERN